MVDVSLIEARIDRAITAGIPISTSLGGIDVKDYGQFMELAKTMATAKHSIPQWLRGSPGDCLMIWQRAHRWGMDPYFVAEKSYLMINPRTGESKVGWESQLIHAVIEAMAPLKGRLRHRYEGEGDNIVCIVSATFKGEDSPHEYRSEPLGKRIKDIGTSEKGNFRGSPLWKQKPRVQLFYDASRDWARINCPDVLAGVYSQDELADMEPVDVTPTNALPPESKSAALSKRLRDANAKHATSRGLDVDHVVRETSKKSTIIEGEINSDPVKEVKNVDSDESNVEGRQPDAGDASWDADDSVRSVGADRGPTEGGTADARSQTATVSGQGEIFPADSAAQPKGKSKR